MTDPAPPPQGQLLVVDSWFDGVHEHREQTSFVIERGHISAIMTGDHRARWAEQGFTARHGAFLMPSLIDAHVHLFLDGALRDPASRAKYLHQSASALGQQALRHARQALACGVALVRDAGDRFGINHRVRADASAANSGLARVRSCGIGLKRSGGYGALMATDVGDAQSIQAAIADRLPASDEIKVFLTGLIDFVAGAVIDAPQFTLEEMQLIVQCAHQRGRKVLAHCSGAKGLAIAVRAGVDSIEHGFFMSRETLAVMRDRALAWVPTFCPVHFQWKHPEWLGWAPNTVGNLRRILDGHAEHVALAQQMGVRLLVGTDAGSMGTPHGYAMLEEITRFVESGVSIVDTLRAATGNARSHAGNAAASLGAGLPLEALLLRGSPFVDLNYLQAPQAVWAAGAPL